jgi:hypothetical protein
VLQQPELMSTGYDSERTKIVVAEYYQTHIGINLMGLKVWPNDLRVRGSAIVRAPIVIR